MSALIELPRPLYDEAVATRRDLHRHPELGFAEHRTAALVAKRLNSANIDVHTGIARTGVVGVLRGAKPGRTIMLRADMDALPMPEESEHEYRSENAGITHACGHDGHVAMLLAAADLLAERRDEVAGTLVFAFQPAEEGAGGARLMVEEGLLERFGVECAYGLHLTSMLPLGMTAFRAGPLMASADEFALTIRGRGGHAALPHSSIDPILTAANVVTSLQAVVSRHIDPVEPAVVSICSLHAGTTYNVIPSEATLKGTVRTFNDDVRQTVEARMRRIIAGTCDAAEAEFELDYHQGFPVTINDEAQAGYVRALATRVLGEAAVMTSPLVMGSEDFSYYAQAVPACFYFIGTRSDERTSFPNHHGRFDIDERALETGIRMTIELGLDAPRNAP